MGQIQSPPILAGTAANQPYETGVWTPVLTFAVPGDLSVAYTDQTGVFVRIGNLVYVSMRVDAIPTYTTASGQIIFTGLPFAAVGNGNFPVQFSSAATWPVGATDIFSLIIGGLSDIRLRSNVPAGLNATWNASPSFPSGAARIIATNGVYRI